MEVEPKPNPGEALGRSFKRTNPLQAAKGIYLRAAGSPCSHRLSSGRGTGLPQGKRWRAADLRAIARGGGLRLSPTARSRSASLPRGQGTWGGTGVCFPRALRSPSKTKL